MAHKLIRNPVRPVPRARKGAVLLGALGLWGVAWSGPSPQASGAPAVPAAQAASRETEQSCQAQDYAQAAAAQASYWPKQMPAQTLDSACWLSAEQLTSALSGPAKPTLLDVRPRSVQRMAPVAGALQIELADIASKRFLQQQSIVLIGSGLDYADINQACQQLRQQGFASVQALLGGASAWQAAGLKASTQASTNASAGASADAAQLQTIDAAGWIASLSQGVQWTVLSINAALQQASTEQLPVPSNQIVAIRAEGKELSRKLAVSVQRAYQNAALKPPNASAAQALIVVVDGAASDSLRAPIAHAIAQAQTQANAQTLPRVSKAPAPATAASPSHALPVYWLQGGWQGYLQQVAQNAAIQQTASHRLQVPCGRM